MGTTYADITLLANGNRQKKRLLVDTGASLSWIRATTLKAIGIKAIQERSFETIEGRRIKRPLGEVQIEFEGQRVHTLVVFAGAHEGEVLGLHALEGLMVEVDPNRRRLKPTKILKAY